ncbi:MAG: hypothetical protein GYA30_05760 [Chloroflexi bacterium]|nr:hypothetical protein [Chloroflexota bacterium]OQA93969.1 MAG: hypothetical protein BWY25_03061 [Chloroflexi bacterium ADurb.Bin222]
MSPNKRQQKLERKAAKRKKQKAQQRSRPVAGRKAQLRLAATWPVMECWVNRDWRDPTKLNQVVLARRDPTTGMVALASYLVDRACLGVKNALVANFPTAQEYRERFLRGVQERQDMIQVDVNLAAAIIKAGLDYAASLKLHPHRDYAEAALLLGDADPTAVTEEIPVGGPEGKPFFIAGPYDNPTKIIAHLERLLGPEGYHFMAPLDPATGMFLESEDEEDWLEIEDEAEDEDE